MHIIRWDYVVCLFVSVSFSYSIWKTVRRSFLPGWIWIGPVQRNWVIRRCCGSVQNTSLVMMISLNAPVLMVQLYLELYSYRIWTWQRPVRVDFGTLARGIAPSFLIKSPTGRDGKVPVLQVPQFSAKSNQTYHLLSSCQPHPLIKNTDIMSTKIKWWQPEQQIQGSALTSPAFPQCMNSSSRENILLYV